MSEEFKFNFDIKRFTDKRPEPKTPTDEEFWKKCEIPTRFRKTDKDLKVAPSMGLEWMDKLKVIQNLIDNEKGFTLAIRGPRGTGKTQMAIEALKYGYRRGVRSRMTSARDIQLATTASFKSSEISDRDVLESFIWVPLLLIDEFDWQPDNRSHYYNSNLFYILDKRYSWCKSTILTSNATIEQFQQQTDPGILSRMAESGGRIDCDGWCDYRRNK
jgi:DNA replication protein DnaC